MDYEKLAAEIGKPAYSGKSDAEIVAALKAPIPGPHVDVSVADVVASLALAGRLYGIEQLALEAPTKDANHDAAVIGAHSLLALCRVSTVLQTSNDAKRDAIFAMLGALVVQGTISEADGAAIVTLTETTSTVCASIDFAEIGPMDEESALAHLQLARGEDPQAERRDAALAAEQKAGITRNAAGMLVEEAE